MHVILKELHELFLPEHGKWVLNKVNSSQSAVSLLAQCEHADVQARDNDSVCGRQFANADGLRGRVFRTVG